MRMTERTATVIITVAFLASLTTCAVSPDHTAQRIEACMSQPGMQYYSSTCLPARD